MVNIPDLRSNAEILRDYRNDRKHVSCVHLTPHTIDCGMCNTFRKQMFEFWNNYNGSSENIEENQQWFDIVRCGYMHEIYKNHVVWTEFEQTSQHCPICSGRFKPPVSIQQMSPDYNDRLAKLEAIIGRSGLK